jgi:hypothetical protein
VNKDDLVPSLIAALSSACPSIHRGTVRSYIRQLQHSAVIEDIPQCPRLAATISKSWTPASMHLWPRSFCMVKPHSVSYNSELNTVFRSVCRSVWILPECSAHPWNIEESIHSYFYDRSLRSLHSALRLSTRRNYNRQRIYRGGVRSCQ